MMVRSQGTTISVKVPINWDVMTDRSRQRLRQIVGRDTRVIRAFLGIIEQHESELLTGRKKNKIRDGALEKLTLTAIKVKTGYDQRPIVLHDFKTQFPRISTNELQECRQTAVSLYESYLTLREKKGWIASRPTAVNATRRIPRWVFTQRFKLVYNSSSTSRWWLNLRDTLDSVQEGRTIHDRLFIPLMVSPFHINQFNRGDVKACQIFNDRSGKWWVNLAVRVSVSNESSQSKPLVVLGIDLGIEKAVCATLVTPKRVSETRYFKQNDKVEVLKKYDQLVANLQREASTRQKNDGVFDRLRQIRHKRENVAREYDRVLVRSLLNYIVELSEKYTVYVAIGRLKNIRNVARKGNFKGRRFRGMIHSWAFARITKSLKHGLAQQGWSIDGKNSRFHAVPEAWTSIKCWKCGRTGIRPRQSLFVCSCGFRTNADRNGSLNIARRLIKLIPLLRNEKGLGRWAFPERAPAPKAGRKSSSKRKPSLSKKEPTSGSGESAAVHFVQSDLVSFSDEAIESDNDPAVASTVEILSVAGSDAPAYKQEKEARPSGGIPSQ